MAPRTLDGLAHGMASDDHIRLGNPEFTNIDGLAPVNSLLLGQALRSKDLDFIADHLGKENGLRHTSQRSIMDWPVLAQRSLILMR